MAVDLTTTNALLGILAVVSLLEGMAVIGLFVGAYLVFRRITATIAGIEERQFAPAAARLNGILDDLKCVTGVARSAAHRADTMAGWWRRRA